MTRRTLIGAAAGLIALGPLKGLAMEVIEQKPPPIPPELVKAFVGAGHGDLPKVEAMLKETPGLLNATWDWGGGDIEAAIGGAGHMGRADIARYLIKQAARFDIFVGAMLGELDMVKAMLKLDPAVAKSLGPHGITLIRHAEMGGDGAKPVLEYLKSLGG